MKIIDMYLNPKTGVYEAQLKPHGRIVFMYPSTMEENVREIISRHKKENALAGLAILCIEKVELCSPIEGFSNLSLGSLIEAIQETMYIPVIENPKKFSYPSEFDYRSNKYSSREESMSREQRFNAHRANNSWRRESHVRRKK